MKIIDNKKDYYDYLSGIYGIDDLVVYDRRGSVPSDKICIGDYNPFFSKKILDFSNIYCNYDHPVAFYSDYYKKFYSYSDFRIVIEAGYAHYYIKVERYRIKENDPITIKYTGMSEEDYWNDRYESIKNKWKYRIQTFEKDKEKAVEKISDAPLCIAFYDYNANSWEKRNTPQIIKNPILKDIPGIAGNVDPYWIWQNVYDYISSQKDKPIIDNRTNNEHIESAGFDKKTSFRNIK